MRTERNNVLVREANMHKIETDIRKNDPKLAKSAEIGKRKPFYMTVGKKKDEKM